MQRTKKAERKPLSFSTTMRNPDRIAGFLDCLLPYENMILTSDVINKVIKKVLGNKLYKTVYQARNIYYKDIYYDEDKKYTEDDLIDIMKHSPQQHKEAGFDYGWNSRFDTWYKLSMEFGFVYYEMNEQIHISNTGHMLIDAYNEMPVNERKIQDVMLNALMKYQTNNPFRKNANSNAPLPLLLNVIDLLKKDKKENNAGVSRQELSILICWRDNNAEALYNYIKTLRVQNGFNYSDEFIYAKCLEILGADDTKHNRFKMSQICGEAVDEYIRKMRSSGIISLRGNGRFIDFNMIEEDKIHYVIDKYSEYPVFTNKYKYYEYMGQIDNNILEIKQSTKIDLTDVKKQTLYRYAKGYSQEKIFEELLKVCNKKESTDNLLKFINAPTRLEFLTSISLVQQFEGLNVNPNYSVDDEGLPIFTAGGGTADIECFDSKYNSYFEVTLMCGRQDQVNNEIVPIRRHLRNALQKNPLSFSVFVAPVIHEDTVEVANLYKIRENLDILTFNINEFIEKIKQKQKIEEFIS
jgi:glutaredoxin-related protein